MSDQPDQITSTHHPLALPYASDEPGATVPLFPLPTGAEDQTAILLPQGPIPTHHDYTPRRIPHLGHAFIFVVNTGLVLLLAQGLFLALSRAPHNAHTARAIASSLEPKLLLASMAIAYITTLLMSWSFFPLLWHRTFAEGIQWNLDTARRNALKLIPLGLVLGWTVQAISSLIPVPKSIPMDDFFRTPSDVWLVTLFGTLLAPMFEEICFRGFLLPAFAIAYDWLSLPKLPIAHERWKATTNLTTPALIFSGILTSIFFALIHAEQLAHAWVALFVLFCVSLVLTFVRIRTKSVACSTLVHACYNLSVFISLFIATGGYRHLDRITR
jgi:membrane protease YdiL (CAAX protease family)